MKVPGPVVLVFLIGLAAGSWWLANRERVEDAPVSASGLRQPGYYLVGATLEQTDASGRVQLRVRAEHAEQDPRTSDVQLTKIQVDYYVRQDGARAATARPADAPPERPWVATADTGRLPPGGQQVTLAGDVRLTGRTGVGPQQAVIRTEHLKLDVRTSVATTSDPVRVDLAPHTLNARGLRADLKGDRLQLESEVHGRFTP